MKFNTISSASESWVSLKAEPSDEF